MAKMLMVCLLLCLFYSSSLGRSLGVSTPRQLGLCETTQTVWEEHYQGSHLEDGNLAIAHIKQWSPCDVSSTRKRSGQTKLNLLQRPIGNSKPHFARNHWSQGGFVGYHFKESRNNESSTHESIDWQIARNGTLLTRSFSDIFAFGKAASRILFSANPVGAALNLAGLACSVASLAGLSFKGQKYACAAAGIAGIFVNAYSGWDTLKDGWATLTGSGLTRDTFYDAASDIWTTAEELPSPRKRGEDDDLNDLIKHAYDKKHLQRAATGKGVTWRHPETHQLLSSHFLLNVHAGHKVLVAEYRDNVFTSNLIWVGTHYSEQGRVMHVSQDIKTGQKVKRENEEIICSQRPLYRDDTGEAQYACDGSNNSNIGNYKYEGHYYGNEAQYDDLMGQFGGYDEANDSFGHLGAYMANDADTNGWRRTCMCTQDGGTYTSTGQFVFETAQQSYEQGFSICYKSNCGQNQPSNIDDPA